MTGLLLILLATHQTVCFVAGGDDRKPAKVTCPVDGTKFDAFEIAATNHWGGKDADGCPHAYKTTPLEYYVWVCPVCKFAGRKRDFEGSIPEADKKALIEGLKPLSEIRKDAKQNQIPGHVKYDLLAQSARIRKAPPEEIGRAYLHAAWSCRQQGAVYLDDFDEWETLRTNYNLNQTPLQFGLAKNRTEFELDVARRLEKDLNGKQYERGLNRILARYLAAFLYRRHGELDGAERWLATLEKVKGENSIVDDAAGKMRASIPLEREYLKKSAEAYQAAYDAGSLEKKVAPEVAYLLGEIARRTGDPKAAAGWFQKAVDTTDSDPLKKLAAAALKALPEK